MLELLIVSLLLIEVIQAQYEGIYCVKDQEKQIDRDFYSYHMLKYEECHFYYLNNQNFGQLTIELNWNGTFKLDFFPLMIVSKKQFYYQFENLYQLRNRIKKNEIFVDLFNFAIESKKQIININLDDEVDNLYIGLYNFGQVKNYFDYEIKIYQENRCEQNCNGQCNDNKCICSDYNIGENCEYPTHILETQQSYSTIPAHSWQYIGVLNDSVLNNKYLNIFGNKETILINQGVVIAFINQDKLSDLPPNLIEMKEDINFNIKNFTYQFSILDNPYKAQLDNKQIFKVLLGIFNYNSYSVKISIEMKDSKEEDSDGSIVLVGQIVIYSIFIILLIFTFLYIFKQLPCRKNNSQENQSNQQNEEQQYVQNQEQNIRGFNAIQRLINRQQESNQIQLQIKTMLAFMPNESYLSIKDNYDWGDQLINECSICLDNMENEQKCRIIYCFHIFHSDCIDQWFKQNDSCPNCRKQYNFKILVEEIEEFKKIKMERKIKKLKNFVQENLKQNQSFVSEQQLQSVSISQLYQNEQQEQSYKSKYERTLQSVGNNSFQQKELNNQEKQVELFEDNLLNDILQINFYYSNLQNEQHQNENIQEEDKELELLVDHVQIQEQNQQIRQVYKKSD